MEEKQAQHAQLRQAQEILQAWPCTPISVAARGEDIVVTTEAGDRLLKKYPQGVHQGFRSHMAVEYCVERGFYLVPRHILNKEQKPLTVFGKDCYGLQDIWQAKPMQWQNNHDLYLLGQTMGQVHDAMMGFHQAYLEQPSVTWLDSAMEMAQIWLQGKEQIPSDLREEWERVCFAMAKQIEILGRQEQILMQVTAAMPFVHNGFCGKEILVLPQGQIWVGGWQNWTGGNSLTDLCAVLHKIAWQRHWDVRAMEAFLTGYRVKGIFYTDMAQVICAWSSLPFAAIDMVRRGQQEEAGATPAVDWNTIFAMQRKKEKIYEQIAVWTRNYWGGGID